MSPNFESELTLDKVDTLEFTSVRIHELALQHWLRRAFPLKDGYPTPVVFTTPRDAHAEFTRLFQAGNNPFAYLLKIKDADGNPVYNPHPSNIFYPLISVRRLSWRLRPSQSYGVHRNRRVYYPTVQPAETPIVGNGTVALDDLAWSGQNQWPTGWDFRFQIDYFCKTPFTLSTYVNRVQRMFNLTGGAAQTYIMARYPFPHGPQYLRMHLESDIDSLNQDSDNDNNQEFRVSIVVNIEGYYVDYFTKFNPVMWYVGVAKEKYPLSPDELDRFFDFNEAFLGLDDVRVRQHNPAISSRPHLPPDATA